jgi:hypothetical protein
MYSDKQTNKNLLDQVNQINSTLKLIEFRLSDITERSVLADHINQTLIKQTIYDSLLQATQAFAQYTSTSPQLELSRDINERKSASGDIIRFTSIEESIFIDTKRLLIESGKYVKILKDKLKDPIFNRITLAFINTIFEAIPVYLNNAQINKDSASGANYREIDCISEVALITKHLNKELLSRPCFRELAGENYLDPEYQIITYLSVTNYSKDPLNGKYHLRSGKKLQYVFHCLNLNQFTSNESINDGLNDLNQMIQVWNEKPEKYNFVYPSVAEYRLLAAYANPNISSPLKLPSNLVINEIFGENTTVRFVDDSSQLINIRLMNR